MAKINVEGRRKVLADGALDEVRAGSSLQERFLALVGTHALGEGSLSWLRSS